MPIFLSGLLSTISDWTSDDRSFESAYRKRNNYRKWKLDTNIGIGGLRMSSATMMKSPTKV